MSILEIPGAGPFPLTKPLIGFKAELEAQLAKFPYEQNVFLMMKFRPGNKALSDFMIEVLSEKGYRGVRADQPAWNITDNVYNPLAVLYCCKFGIALFDEPEPEQAYSANVAYELGVMHYQGKRCLLLRHRSLPTMPFDLIKDLHTPYERELEVQTSIREWVSGLASSPQHASDEGSVQPASQSIHYVGQPLQAEVTVQDSTRIIASDAHLSVLQRRQPYWRLSWKVRVQNPTRGDARYRITVSYHDAAGHSLDQHHTFPPAVLGPTCSGEYSSHYLMDHELAAQVAKARIHVAFA